MTDFGLWCTPSLDRGCDISHYDLIPSIGPTVNINIQWTIDLLYGDRIMHFTRKKCHSQATEMTTFDSARINSLEQKMDPGGKM